MKVVKLSELVDAIASAIQPDFGSSTDLQIPSTPDPYVPPTFKLVDGKLTSEVIFVKAPAAVGKSITARYLSSARNAPLLDLSKVAVGTGSLQGLVSDYLPEGKMVFHRGELPIIIDALDEGRLLSGEKSLEAFIESSVKFIGGDHSVTCRPKIVLIGREESADFSRLVVEIEDYKITTCTLALDFFERDAASQMIDLYDKKELDRQYTANEITKETYDRRSRLLVEQPMKDLKNAYFSAIEGALQVKQGNLWIDDRGRTFAGYAPVLASIGILLASVDNPITVTNRLKASSTREAWDVIDTVIQEILQREKIKVVDKLSEMSSIPSNAYDPEEQLTYLTQLIGEKRNLTLTGNIVFDNDSDSRIYLEKISQICAEHPFVRSGKMANDVLGSRILAHALCNGFDLDELKHFLLLRDLSKGPFLWRSIRREFLSQGNPFLDGKFVGYVLNSYWNDPMEIISRKQTTEISELNDGLVEIRIGPSENSIMTFTAMPPVALYDRVRDCELNASDMELIIEGATVEGGEHASLFRFQGQNAICCGVLQYGAKNAEISGSLWIDAARVAVTVANPDIQTRGLCKYGWGDQIRHIKPWKNLAKMTLSNPFQETPISKLLTECQRNIPANGIVVMRDYSIPENDPQLMWTKKYGKAFPSLLRFFVSNERAEMELVQTRKRENKYRIKVTDVPWEELLKACREDPSVDREVVKLFNQMVVILQSAKEAKDI